MIKPHTKKPRQLQQQETTLKRTNKKTTNKSKQITTSTKHTQAQQKVFGLGSEESSPKCWAVVIKIEFINILFFFKKEKNNL